MFFGCGRMFKLILKLLFHVLPVQSSCDMFWPNGALFLSLL